MKEFAILVAVVLVLAAAFVGTQTLGTFGSAAQPAYPDPAQQPSQPPPAKAPKARPNASPAAAVAAMPDRHETRSDRTSLTKPMAVNLAAVSVIQAPTDVSPLRQDTVAPPPAPSAEPPPFPRAEQIAAGASEDAISKKFGDPNITALTLHGNHILGTYVYARDRGRSATIIQFTDGRVAAAYSKAAPPVPSGYLAPRRRVQMSK